MPETPEKQGHGGRRPGAGRPPKHAEPRETLSVYVPSSTAARIRSHAAQTGRTVSEVVSAILEGADMGDLPAWRRTGEPTHRNDTGYY